MRKAEATRCDARIKVEGYRRRRTVMEESNVWGLENLEGWRRDTERKSRFQGKFNFGHARSVMPVRHLRGGR